MIALDDNIEDHPKFAGLSNDAFALWIRCIGYCRRNLTDGFVPHPIAVTRSRASANARKIIGELLKTSPGCSNPLWHEVEGGYAVHDYLEWNPSKEQVEAKLAIAREKGRKGGLRSGAVRAKHEVVASPLVEAESKQAASPLVEHSACGLVEPKRTPIRSDPIRSEEDQDQCSLAIDGRSDDRPDNVVALPTKKAKPAKRGTRCPASTAEDVDAWLAEHKLPPLDGPWGADVARFLDYWAGVSGAKGTKLDWAATWRNYEADPRFPHPEGAAPGRKRVLGPVAAQQSPMPDLDGPPAFVREGLKAAGIKPIETPINDLGALLDLAAGRA